MRQRLLICTELSASELRQFALAAETRRERQRGLGIAHCLDGMSRVDAARLAGMSDQALVDAVKRYNAEGVCGLKDRPRSGRPPKFEAAHRCALRELVLKGPDVEADGLSAFTRADIAAIAERKWGIAAAVTTVGTTLKAIGLSRQKARQSHPKKNVAAAEAFKKGSRRYSENHQPTS